MMGSVSQCFLTQKSGNPREFWQRQELETGFLLYCDLYKDRRIPLKIKNKK